MKALFVVASAVLIASCAFLAAVSSGKFCERVRLEEDGVREALSILEHVKTALDDCADRSDDLETRDAVRAACVWAEAEDIVVEDVSSGINPALWPEKILKDPRVSALLESDGCSAVYGWASSTLDSREKKFPVSNAMPLLNVYESNMDLVRALCGAAEIRDEGKVEVLIEKIEGRCPMEPKDVLEALSAGSDSILASMFGTKTTFWRVSFSVSGRYKVCGIFAAMPENHSGTGVREYMLVERRADVL